MENVEFVKSHNGMYKSHEKSKFLLIDLRAVYGQEFIYRDDYVVTQIMTIDNGEAIVEYVDKEDF